MGDECICGEINARHCPVHNDHPKPREWTLNLRDGLVGDSAGILCYLGEPPPQSMVAYAVEKSAYTALEARVKELEERLYATSAGRSFDNRNSKDFELILMKRVADLEEKLHVAEAERDEAVEMASRFERGLIRIASGPDQGEHDDILYLRELAHYALEGRGE